MVTQVNTFLRTLLRSRHFCHVIYKAAAVKIHAPNEIYINIRELFPIMTVKNGINNSFAKVFTIVIASAFLI